MKYLLAIAISIALLTGCKTSQQRAVYQTAAVTQVSVDVVMRGWGVYVASGRATIAQEEVVKAAYEKYQSSFAAACDAGAAYAASSVTNGNAVTGYQAAFQYAISNANQSLTDLQNIVTSFGVKLQ